MATRSPVSAGLLLVTPEYNNSLPGGMKNAIDRRSRTRDQLITP